MHVNIKYLGEIYEEILNSTDDFSKESLQGFGAAHQNIITCHYDPNFITRSEATKRGK